MKSNAQVLEVGDVVYVKRWAAQCYTSTYHYLRACEVKQRKDGTQWLKPLSGCAYGRRGYGSLVLPELRPFLLKQHVGKYDLTDYFWEQWSSFVPRQSEIEADEH